MVFAIILVAEFLAGFAGGTAFRSFRQTGSGVSLGVGLLSVAELFALAWLSTQL